MLDGIKRSLMGGLSVVLFIIAGCAIITPTVVPPMTKQLGYSIPNIKGVTTVGIVKGVLRVELEKLRLFDSMATLTLKATEEVKAGIIDVVAVLGLGGTAMLPVAMSRLPKGAVRKDEHESMIKEALAKTPPE